MCGICECNPGYFGDTCQCDGSGATTDDVILTCPYVYLQNNVWYAMNYNFMPHFIYLHITQQYLWFVGWERACKCISYTVNGQRFYWLCIYIIKHLERHIREYFGHSNSSSACKIRRRMRKSWLMLTRWLISILYTCYASPAQGT